ncbi:MAG: hypothetical protein K2X38_09760 [Gemmataceae bacterium]|nr:hypothetical protein [Gemmataceae bacterium]
MKASELISLLAEVDPQSEVLLSLNSIILPASEMVAIRDADFIVLRSKRTEKGVRRFTVAEDGLIGHMVRLRITEDEMAKALDRPVRAVKTRRKHLGF